MAIFNTIDELKTTVKINASSPFENWLIYIGDARDQFLVPYLGFEIVDKLEQLDAVSTSDEDKKYINILPMVRRVLGPFAVSLSTDEMSIRTGDAGHTVEKSDKVAPASDAKIARAYESLLSRGWENLELLLEYLESNSNDYPEWKQSKFYKNRQTKYFPSSEVFQDAGLIDIEYSRLTFEKLRQLIIRIEETEVADLLTAELEEQLFTNSDDPKLLLLLKRVRAYIGSRVAELHTSQTTRVQRSKNNNLEYKGVIRPLYADEPSSDQNYYKAQAAYWLGEITVMLPDLGVAVSNGKVDWNNKDRHLFSAL